MSENLLSIRNLSIRFSTGDFSYAVKNVSFQLNRREIVALVGESGSGKSVTAKAITKLLPKSANLEGTVLFAQSKENLLSAPERVLRKIRGKKISYVFQEPGTSFNPVFTVGSQLLEVLAHAGYPKSERKERAIKVLGDLGIDSPEARLSAYPYEFSGGMLQRLAIAIALAPSPDLIIADEPTTALDAKSRLNILKILKEICSELGTTVLFITHDLGCLPSFADRVIVMQKGEFVEENKTMELLYSPNHAYTRQLVEAVPKLKR